MNAPAFRKNRNSAPSVPTEAAPSQKGIDLPAFANSRAGVERPHGAHFGGAYNNIMKIPAPTKRSAISEEVAAVIVSTIAEMTQSRASFLFVRRASLIAAITMIAITAGAIP